MSTINSHVLSAPPYPLKLGIKTEEHLALNICYPLNTINYFILQKEKNLQEIKILKVKNGKIKERLVYNPTPEYKKLLRAINLKLLRNAQLPVGVVGGVIGKSIDDMVRFHCGKEAIFSIDLKDFFPSITSGRVFNFFLNTGCNNQVSSLLTDLVTYRGILPQGFPTSSSLANLITYGLDIQHLLKCQTENIARTRWIDDIVFSGRTYILKRNINTLIGAIKYHGFKINNKKTSFIPRIKEPIVCGLKINNRRPEVPTVIINKVRDILQECLISDINLVQEEYECEYNNKSKNFKRSLEGRIRYIQKFNTIEGAELLKLFNQIKWNMESNK